MDEVERRIAVKIATGYAVAINLIDVTLVKLGLADEDKYLNYEKYEEFVEKYTPFDRG